MITIENDSETSQVIEMEQGASYAIPISGYGSLFGRVPVAYHPQLPMAAYLVTLIRAQGKKLTVWPTRLQDELPVVTVPLRDPDPDVPLELGSALVTIYDEALYELSVDYTQSPPPPPLAPEEETWLKERLVARSR